MFDAIRLLDLSGDVSGEIERAGVAVGQQRFGFLRGVLRHNHQVGAEALLHAGHTGVEVHGQHGAAEERQRKNGDDGEQGAGAEWLTLEIFKRQAAQCDMRWHDGGPLLIMVRLQ